MQKAVDLRHALGPVRNQGPLRGTCVSFALTAAHEHQRIIPSPGQLSIETLYWGAKQHDGLSGQGTTFQAADTALQSWGQPLEELWPYDPLRTDVDASYQPPPAAVESSNCWTAKLIEIAPTINAIEEALDRGFVVSIGIPTWPGLLRPVGSQLQNPKSADLDGELHAVTVVGYRLDTAEILLRNSWGSMWGDHGHAWIAHQFLDDHAISAWQLTPLELTVPNVASSSVVEPTAPTANRIGNR